MVYELPRTEIRARTIEGKTFCEELSAALAEMTASAAMQQRANEQIGEDALRTYLLGDRLSRTARYHRQYGLDSNGKPLAIEPVRELEPALASA